MRIDFKIKGNIILLILMIIYPFYTSVFRLLSFDIHRGYNESTYGQPETIFQLTIYSLILFTLFIGCVFIFLKKKIGVILVRASLITMLVYLLIKIAVAASFYLEYVKLLDVIIVAFIIFTLFNIKTENLISFFKEEKLKSYKNWNYPIIISLVYGILLFCAHW